MIAASDPQEFVPSGRQQAFKHPGPNKFPLRKFVGHGEDLLLDKLEKVSLREQQDSEWWILRKTPVKHSIKCHHTKNNFSNKSYVQLNPCKSCCRNEFLDDSYSEKSTNNSLKTSKRVSDNFSKYSSKSENTSVQNEAFVPEDTKSAFHGKNEITFLEEELYVKGNIAIWSKGISNSDNGDGVRKTVCAYTSPLPIKHAAWTTFHCEHPIYETETLPVYHKLDEPTGIPVPAICIIDSNNIRVFTQKGEDFVTAIPFQISKMWNMKYGIFLEKEIENHNNFFGNRASLFSLAFPLDEVCPVAVNNGSHVQLLNDNSLKVVYTNEEPSICMIYDSHSQQHVVYLIRKVTNNETMDLANKLNSTAPSNTSISNKLKSRLSMWDCMKNYNYLQVPSPMNSRPGSVASLYNIHQSKSYSSMATVSRCQSPASSSLGSPWLQRPRLNCSIPCSGNEGLTKNCSFFDSSKVMSYLNSNPVICLDQIWTDSVLTQDDRLSGPASKVFLCDDLTDQWYLCYVVPTRCQLSMVKIDFANQNCIRFGVLNTVSAKDAVPIPMLHMLAILEYSGNVNLYSGLNPVGKLHVGGTLVQHTPSPYVRRNFSQFNSPFPRRSSLLPHCKQSDPKFDEHLLSPVLAEMTDVASRTNIMQMNFQLETNLPKAVLNGLRDPIENRITLRYSDGTYYRVSLPPLTSHPLIGNCITCLKRCLSVDTVSVVLTRWYATRNALGAQELNLQQEWKLFEALLFELLGYSEQDQDIKDCPITPSSNPKRQRHSALGTDEDWSFITNSVHETKLGNFLRQKLHLKSQQIQSVASQTASVQVTTNSVLFSHMKLIHYCFHLFYEDLKLNTLRYDDLELLAVFLNKLAADLGLVEYALHYWKDFPNVCTVKLSGNLGENEKALLTDYSFVTKKPPHIMQFIYDLMMKGSEAGPYPYVNLVNCKSRDIIQICGLIFKEIMPNLAQNTLIKIIEPTCADGANFVSEPEESESVPAEQATMLMIEKNISVADLDTLPPAIYLLMYSTLWKCRDNPPPDLPAEAYYLLWRDDLAVQAAKIEKVQSEASEDSLQPQTVVPTSKQGDGEQDGMEHVENPVIKLRFPDDVRVAEARKMLQSSKPVPVVIVQGPDVSDHDFIEEQEKHLYAICTRTMALSPGRGMFTLRTTTPVITQPLQTPPLCLTGKAPPKGTSVELNHIDTPSNMNLWPLFHNGVASGLRIAADADNIDNTWIIFNKPKTSVEQQMEHAGFLMALGLNGHLRNLDVLNTYDYLVKLHEMTSIGILLGLSAAFRGTSHLGMTKTLSIHVEALLPPTSMELDVHQNVQVAALLGIGLVYQATSHRHIIEVLLSEIGRPPGPEMENSIDRESYSLAAGLSLGLVTLKQGSCSLGLSDLNISDRLYYYMVGGNRRSLTGAQKDKYKVPSFQIREGSTVNLDVTAPGATIALGLMYFGSGNRAVADWMAPPKTQYLLDFVRPDFLMFRMLARALILWDDVEPTKEWIQSQVPDSIRSNCMVRPTPNSDIDYEAMNQAYCNIVTGACYALGLKYAGSADEDAFKTLLHFCHMFTNLTVKSIAELAGKPTVETCLNVLLLSTSMVMAGTGNLDVMRLVRMLRRRVGVTSSAVVTYGSHLALHMSLGLLFLGGGRYTLSNSPTNVAALICAFYPKFPTHSNDNRYHLQAFRHLYVLAVEPRLIIPKDVHSGQICYSSLQVVKIDGTTSFVKGPGIIPDLNGLQKVMVDDERYWPVVFKRGRNWEALEKVLTSTGFIEVKQRAGCLSYVVDKLGYHSQLAKTLTRSEMTPWDPPSSSIISFTHDEAIKSFCDHFLAVEKQSSSMEESKLRQMLMKITYDAVVKDKLVIVPVVTFLSKVISDLTVLPNAMNFWQFKLIVAQVLSTPLSCNLLAPEVILALEQQLIEILSGWEGSLLLPLRSYRDGLELVCDKEIVRRLALYVIFYDIPFKYNFCGKDYLECLVQLQNNFSCRSAEKILKICADDVK